MNEDVCFYINGNNLICEKVLVEFNIPLLFICKDQAETRYSVLCIDSDLLKYIIIKSNLANLIKMLESQITMRELFLTEKYVWVVEASDDVLSDIVMQKESSCLTNLELPEKNAFFNLKNKAIEDYIFYLKNEGNNIITLDVTKNDRYFHIFNFHKVTTINNKCLTHKQYKINEYMISDMCLEIMTEAVSNQTIQNTIEKDFTNSFYSHPLHLFEKELMIYA